MKKNNNKDMKTSVFFFLSNLSGGGAQRTIVNILNGIDKSKYNVKLILLKLNSDDAYVDLVHKSIPIINLNTRGRYAFWKIKKIIDKEKPDILFSTLAQVNLAVWLGHKCSFHKPKLVLRETSYRTFGKNLNRLSHLLFKRMYNDADNVIALSKGVKNDLIELYGVKSDKITTIYNPIDTEYIFEKSKEECELGYSKDFKMVSCGRLVEQKNYSLIINALSIIKNKGYENFELFILGEGPKRDELNDLILECGLEGNVKLVGFQNNPYKYMAQADLFVLSSAWEGFGHVVAEALATGTPVLSTDCPHGPKEILQDGEFGWIVDNNDYIQMSDKLIEIIDGTIKYDDYKSISRERAQDFDVSKIVIEYQNVLRLGS
ncbi:MAG: hypothetical protein AVO33_01285 [delta proteobacterium ML8_F1]|nr:MAG: hypothetical protein AVO33_01285 [delta proteobacterium ML8_F1]